MKLLVVEDEPKLNKGLVQGLQSRGYAVDFAFDGEEGERLARVNHYDLILLDVMIPKKDGLEVCRTLRAHGVQTPILFLTARDAVEDKIRGLDMGGDDYLVKPFSFDELVARMRTLLRRPPLSASDVLELGGLRLDTRSQKVMIDGKEIYLTLREYGLLEYFLRNKEIVVTREDILTHVWDRFFDSFSNVVDVHLKNLRKKLPKIYAKRIQTVWGKGYRIT
ncbi:MAG: Response regulator receiver domain protein (CheY-like) [Candidatus Uhrbacteria bacterium GW2011_GWF2_41_16]|uniref:Response regulator receiver domain protein (CheY-like) n=2 Tax=Candidatus Uhriibacteriota TaxID=1752732 RepID=A0A0G0XMV5_9BACT|nr:MAG: Response regulator receiver domain protein (CheY-like) [Candidatus Uhrbacteria bacterium GW2011_GWC2_41_11]KKR98100.1 MAG: Response regulator receiver domain protein (CheY-like) [Candidatus Uhrbacteria bacterium GW2011_GWF2_41_16]